MKISFFESHLLLLLFYIISCAGHIVLFMCVFGTSYPVRDAYNINKLVHSNFTIQHTFLDANHTELHEKKSF